jgi:hypothetical protein
MLGSGGTIAWSPANVPSCATTRACIARRWRGVRPAVRTRLTVSVGRGGSSRPGSEADAARHAPAFHATRARRRSSRPPRARSSCTQASVAEYRRRTLAQDDLRACCPTGRGRPQSLHEAGTSRPAPRPERASAPPQPRRPHQRDSAPEDSSRWVRRGLARDEPLGVTRPLGYTFNPRHQDRCRLLHSSRSRSLDVRSCSSSQAGVSGDRAETLARRGRRALWRSRGPPPMPVACVSIRRPPAERTNCGAPLERPAGQSNADRLSAFTRRSPGA